MPPTTSLLNRSPRSRKSLAPASTDAAVAAAPTAKRKRPHSIAPGEHLRLDDSRRRSLMRPTRGILKPSNQADEDSSQAYPPLDDSHTTVPPLEEFLTEVQDHNTSRKSLGARRVSFAARAYVRVFTSAEQDGARTESPNSSPASSSSASGPSDAESSPQQMPEVQAPGIASASERRASVTVRRRSNIHAVAVEGEEGEESMEVSDDEIPPPRAFTSPAPPPVAPHSPPSPDLHSDSDNSIDEDGNMSMTREFGAGIVARRRTMSMAGRRKSARMRSSIAGPPNENGEESMEFTVALDRPPQPESDALKALRAVANANTTDRSVEAGETDMDVTTALTRLMNVRNNIDSSDTKNDSFSSTEDSFDGLDAGDRTVNMTNLMGSFRASENGIHEDGDVTMSSASIVAAPVVLHHSATPTNIQRPTSISSTLTPPPPQRPPTKAIPGPLLNSPTKPSVKQFTAAFAPQYQPLKRPAPSPAAQSLSPNKRRAITFKDQRVPIPAVVESASPKKGLPSRARRPSGYYRKSIAGSVLPSEAAPPQKRLSASITGVPPRRSPAPLSPTKKAAAAEEKPPPFTPHFATDTLCAREERRQSIAVPSPTRGSPAPVSPRLSSAPTSGEVIEEVEGAAILSPARGIDPAEWASAVQGESVPQDDLEPISVDNFFMMTGIRFMDDLTCPRRSTVHPSQLQRRESNEGEDRDYYPLSDYAVAMAVDVAQLETMTWIANDIRSAIAKYKEQYRQTEDDATKDIPLLFREFATAPEKDREQLLYVLKLIKAYTIGSAKASWYEWKRGWVQGLQTNAERTLDNLDADERQLDDIAKRAGETLPGLRTEYEQITRELELETAAVAEIENCDQQFLSELKGTIAEQRQELDVYRNDIQDGQSKLARLEEKLEELEDQAQDAKKAISTAQRQMDMQKSSTRAGVFRLQDELCSLQGLHLWRATALSSDYVEFVYDSRYLVIIPCRRFTPIPEAVDVRPVGDQTNFTDDFPLVTEIMYRAARRHVVHDEGKLTLRIIIQRLTDFWASYAQLRWQLSFIIIKYPLSLQFIPAGASLEDAEGFKATATFLLFKRTSKAHINFYFDSQMLGNWPMSTPFLRYDVAVAYGKADSHVLGEAVKKRLSEVNMDENHACLVDACMEVVSRYS